MVHGLAKHWGARNELDRQISYPCEDLSLFDWRENEFLLSHSHFPQHMLSALAE